MPGLLWIRDKEAFLLQNHPKEIHAACIQCRVQLSLNTLSFLAVGTLTSNTLDLVLVHKSFCAGTKLAVHACRLQDADPGQP